MAGRYTQRRFRPQYNPISFDQFAQAPLAAQMLHDQTIGSAQAQQEYLNNLPWHEKQARELESNLAGQIDSLTKKITSSDRGIYDVDPATELANIATYKREKFAPGQSQIQGALAARQDLKERYQKLVDKGDRDPAQMEAALAMFDKQSRDMMSSDGTVGYSGRILAADPNMQKLALDYVKSLPKHEVLQQTGWMLDESTGRWIQQETGRVYKGDGTPDSVMALAKNYLATNQDVQNYLRDQSMLAEQMYGVTDINKYQNDLLNQAVMASGAMAFDNRSVKQNMKNASDLQMYGSVLKNALVNPTVRNSNYITNNSFSKQAVEIATSTELKDNFKIIDGEGNMVMDESLAKEIAQGENIPLDQAYEIIYNAKKNGFRRERSTGFGFAGEARGLNASYTPEAPYTEESQILQKYAGVQKYTDADRRAFAQKANEKLTGLMNQYNESLPEGYPQARNLEQFKRILEQEYNNGEQILIKTVDYNVKPNDTFAKDLQAGRLSTLLGKSIKVKASDDDDLEVDGSGKKAAEFVEERIKNKAKVSSVKMIATGPMAGGREFTLADEDGTTYTVYTEPSSTNDSEAFIMDRQLTEELADPTFIGKGTAYPVDHPDFPDQANVVYSPTRFWQNGQLVQGVEVVITDKEGNPISQSEVVDMDRYIELREADRRSYNESRFTSQYLQNKVNPNQ